MCTERLENDRPISAFKWMQMVQVNKRTTENNGDGRKELPQIGRRIQNDGS
jgi:hypothetical protein